MGTLDTPLKRGRRSTIHDDKRGLCAGEVTERELTRLLLEFRLASGILAEPSPAKLRFQMIIVRAKGSLKTSTQPYASRTSRAGSFSGDFANTRICVKAESCASNSADLCA